MCEYSEFYVYAYLDPRKPGEFKYENLIFDHEPFYIGKGYYNRSDRHIRQAELTEGYCSSHKINKIRGIISSGLRPIVIRVMENLSDKEALKLEMQVIASIGRRNIGTGPLTNLTDGGEGGAGRVFSDEIRKNMSDAHLGNTPWNKGLKLPPEVGKRISESKKGSIPWNKGKPATEEARLNQSKAHKGPYKWAEDSSFRRCQNLVRFTLETLSNLQLQLSEETFNSVKARNCPRFDQLSKYYTLAEANDVMSKRG